MVTSMASGSNSQRTFCTPHTGMVITTDEPRSAQVMFVGVFTPLLLLLLPLLLPFTMGKGTAAGSDNVVVAAAAAAVAIVSLSMA